MKRKAFLIASPQIEGTEDFLPGVTPDITNMRNHLYSLKGGAWDTHEISTFMNPKKNELIMNIHGSYDFVIVQYSGHGYEYTNKGTFLNINPHEKISLNDIHQYIDCPRIYYFIDCCRGVVHERITEMKKTFSLDSSSALDLRDHYRKRFDSIVTSCETGYSIIYSCSMNESAGEDGQKRGGIFSYSYFRSANSITNVPEDQYYSIKNIFEIAKDYIGNNYPMAARSQHPTMQPERRNNYYPFVI